MHRQTGRHGFRTAPFLRLVIALTIGLALSCQAATAKECARETPLPAEVHLIAPGADVPEAVARFAGIWSGEVAAERGGLCTTLVVEEVLASGFARVIVSVVPPPPWTSACRGSCPPPDESSMRPCACR
jgi:hypothetical protein